MARQESDREDLLTEATAFPRRAELQSDTWRFILFAGFRKQGGCSLYFEQDPVFHFDTDARLRKAFWDGCLYRTQGTTLARLRRHREPHKSELLRSDLSPEELNEFKEMVQRLLRQVLMVLIEQGYTVVGQVPEADPNLVNDLKSFIEQVLQNRITLAPQIATRP